MSPGERAVWKDFYDKCRVFDPEGGGPAPTPVTYHSPYYAASQANGSPFSPQPSASLHTHSAATSRASSASLTPGFVPQPTHSRLASPAASLYAHSTTTSRASSASLTPEPEQRFQCPDCHYDFESRAVLVHHLQRQYRKGWCSGAY
ncbi:hypothetical protein AURDEDRAFT_112602 [Auricularia subglabra TFB-10046 SS5]|nr:hypothetical protein AURDEDRAFT_112602 [Auricularia subglabra TFB-10046 SS5]